MLVVCGGQNRSGSTWQFNVVRDLVMRAYPDSSVRSGWIDNVRPLIGQGLVVAKAHCKSEIVDLEPEVVVTCYRDLRAVAGSLVRMKWCSAEWVPINNFLEMYVEEREHWRQSAHWEFRYEDMIKNRKLEVGRCALALGINAPSEVVASVAMEVSRLAPSAGMPAGTLDDFDPLSLLHVGHVGPADRAAEAHLPPDLWASITEHYGPWLEAHGYRR